MELSLIQQLDNFLLEAFWNFMRNSLAFVSVRNAGQKNNGNLGTAGSFSAVPPKIHTISMDNFRPNHMNRVFHSGAVSDTIEASGGMDMQIRLAENIRALRRQHRFTQEQLAESLGVTPGAVYKWEAGVSHS